MAVSTRPFHRLVPETSLDFSFQVTVRSYHRHARAYCEQVENDAQGSGAH